MPELLAPADLPNMETLREGQDPGQRGNLIITASVVEHVAMIAALAVEGVIETGSGLDKVLGQRYPKVDATIAGRRALIQVEIAVAWPSPLGQVSGRVRKAVRDRVIELTGLQVDAVDVFVANVESPALIQPRRVQ